MSATVPKVLMIGTDPRGQGGIASVVAVLQRAGFFERNQVRYLATHADGTRWQKLRAASFAMLSVLFICIRHRAPIVHAHCASRASFFRKSLLLGLARACGSKTVFHLHGAEFRQFANAEAGPLARWWIRHTLASSSVVLALSGNWARFLSALAPSADVRVLANGVELKAPAGAGEEQAARILFLGRAERRKGIFELLAAVAALHPRFPGIELVIGGDGDLAGVRRLAERLGIGAQVSILGWITPQERELQLRRAAIFTLPSHDEGFPMAMLEAMAAGKAIVVTPVGGIPEAVNDHDNGILVAPGDAAALAAALQLLLDDPGLRARLAGRARETVGARFSVDVVTVKLAAIYGELEGRGGP